MKRREKRLGIAKKDIKKGEIMKIQVDTGTGALLENDFIKFDNGICIKDLIGVY